MQLLLSPEGFVRFKHLFNASPEDLTIEEAVNAWIKENPQCDIVGLDTRVTSEGEFVFVAYRNKKENNGGRR